MRNKFLISALISAIFFSACNDDDDNSSTIIPSSAEEVLQKAVGEVGGTEELNNLSGLSYEASGTYHFDDEGYSPNDFYQGSNIFVKTFSHDVTNDQLHIAAVSSLGFELFSTFPPLNYTEVIHTNVGSRSSGSTVFDDPSVDNYSIAPARLGALQRNYKLLNPHLFLLQGLATPANISSNGQETIDGQSYDLLVIKDPIQDVTLFVNSVTGEIKRLETMELGVYRRDVRIRVEYSEWTETNGLSFPLSVSLFFDNILARIATRSNFDVNPTFDATLFNLADIDSSALSEDAIADGALRRQFYITFQETGFPSGGALNDTEIVETEVMTGVHYLGGTGAGSLVIEQSDSVILLEAPASEQRATVIIEWVNDKFGGNKPIKYLVPTHHHQDHASGVRTIMAEGGVTLVVASETSIFWENTILAASSTLGPDSLELNPISGGPSIMTITEGTTSNVTIGDNQPVIIHRIENTHAEGMIIASITAGTNRIIFEADLYNIAQNTITLGGPNELFTKLKALGFIDMTCQATDGTTLSISATHGGVSELIDVTTSFLQETGIEIPCN